MTNWITTDEAVDISGYHIVHLRRLIRGGLVKAEKKGGAWWVDGGSLRRLMREAARSPDGRRGGRASKSSHSRVQKAKTRQK